MKSGNAEIFGTEITVGPTYSFSGVKSAIYTWQGCELEIRGSVASSYVSDEAPMMAYLNTHFALNRLRGHGDSVNGQRGETSGPRVMIVGPRDSGKTSLVKILAAYALKSGQNPVLVNLDPGEVSCPPI